MLVLVGEDGGCGVRLLVGPNEAEQGDDPEQALCHTNNQPSSLLSKLENPQNDRKKRGKRGENNLSAQRPFFGGMSLAKF